MKIGSFPIPQPRELQQLLDGNRASKSSELNPAEGIGGMQIAGTGAAKPDFTNILERAVTEVNGKMQAADSEKTKLFTGETNNLHQAMIAMQEASVAFSLMVEMRNKLVEGYQEVMRMQV